MMSQMFTDYLAKFSSLPCTGKSCGRQPSAEPTTSERSIVGYTSLFFAGAQRRCVSYSIFLEVSYAI